MQHLRTIALWLALGLVTLAAACDNTIRGVGQDVQDTGEALEDAVN